MSRRLLLALSSAASACAAIALVVYFSASTPSALASRAAGGGSTSEATATITPGSTENDVPTSTPCPPGKVPVAETGGCGTPTATPTSQHPYDCGATPTPVPTNTPGGPTATSTPTTTPCPQPTATPCSYPWKPDPNGPGCRKVTQTPTPSFTPCPPGKVPVAEVGGCGTPAATPTSVRPYGADLRLLNHYPSPAVAGKTKTWVFEMENVGSEYGCETHHVSFSATMTGQASSFFDSGTVLACHETAEITVASVVTAAPGETITIDALAQAGASKVMGHVTASDTVIPVADFNCDGTIDSIDAALVLQLTAALIQPFSCSGAGDVNSDGYTNAVDATLVLQYVAGLIPPFT